MRLQRAIGMLGLALACRTSGTLGPDTTAAGTFLLEVGESMPLAGASLAFVGVGEDSRCPAGFTCVWAGNAAVMFSLRTGRISQLRTINTTLEPRGLEHGGVRVTIESLSPVPFSGRPVDPSTYVVEVRVAPAGGG